MTENLRTGYNDEDNRLLAMIPAELRERLAQSSEVVTMEAGDILFDSGQDIQYTYFPIAPAMVSLVIEVDEKRCVEVATIGQEGAIGGIVSCGDLPAYARSEVQVAGRACRVPMGIVEELKRESLIVRDLFCRYADVLLAQVMQSVACNAFHPIEARAARWLLTAQDRSGDQLELTQSALAALLGVQRTSVNAVARDLQDEGLIRYRRGVVELIDRQELEHRACDCYRLVNEHSRRVIGDAESSWLDKCKD